jgi:hypothetical protein
MLATNPICPNSTPCAGSWCRRIAKPPNVALPCPVMTSVSETVPLDIRECVVGPSDRAEDGSVAQNLPLCECNCVWYFQHNYDAGVPPASFFVDGSQGLPPCDPNLSQPRGNQRSVTSRAASAARAASFKRINRQSRFSQFPVTRYSENVKRHFTPPVTRRVGMEATGHSRWFERLLAELDFELWIGDPAEIKRQRGRKQKTDREDGRLLLRLLLENRFPRIWVPNPENRDLRQLLCSRCERISSCYVVSCF